MSACTNCGEPDARHVTLDLGLPDGQLCDPCALASWSDPALFVDLGRRPPRRGIRADPHSPHPTDRKDLTR